MKLLLKLSLSFLFIFSLSYSKEPVGKKSYEMYCAACHAKDGTGNTPAGKALKPAPRNFTKAEFKYKSTPDTIPPTDADLYQIIADGSKGTAMTPWKGVLKKEQIDEIILYIKSFNSEYWKNTPKTK